MLSRSRGKRYHSSDTAEMGNFALGCWLRETLAEINAHWLLLKKERKNECVRLQETSSPESQHTCVIWAQCFGILSDFKLPSFMKTRCIAGELPVRCSEGSSLAVPIAPQGRGSLWKTCLKCLAEFAAGWTRSQVGTPARPRSTHGIGGTPCSSRPCLHLQEWGYPLAPGSSPHKCIHILLFLRPSLARGYFKGHF